MAKPHIRSEIAQSGSHAVLEADWLLRELDRLPPAGDGDDGLSAQEIRELTGWGRDVCTRRLREAVQAGKLTVGWGYRQAITGMRQRVPVYRRAEPNGR